MTHKKHKKASQHSEFQNNIYQINDTTYIVESYFADESSVRDTLKETLIQYLDSEFAYSTIFNEIDIISIDENNACREGGIWTINILNQWI